VTEPQSTEKLSGKGRPTPKRSEAQRRRRVPVTAPKDRKEAARAARTQNKASRSVYRTALRTGDERHLPPRDAGPVRRYVRDIVDSRRNAGNYVLYAAFGVVLLSAVAGAVPALRRLQYVVVVAYPVMFLYIVVDSIRLARLIRRRVSAAYPGETTKGVGGYGVLRTFQMRRLRMPPPKVKIGDPV
jgi:Protein of unknown function (DUF3043)